MEVESFLSAQLSMTRMMYFLITSSKYYTCITYLCHRSIVGLIDQTPEQNYDFGRLGVPKNVALVCEKEYVHL